MWEDPIVIEVRRVRMEIEAEAEGDFDKIYARAVEIQNQFADRLVSHPTPLPEENQVRLELESV
jgi:hypothetical protein